MTGGERLPLIGPEVAVNLGAPGVEQLDPCASTGMCPRLVRRGVRYCCGACGDGWEATPRHEAVHTETCDRRDTERRPEAIR